jgi:hypothetical protein
LYNSCTALLNFWTGLLPVWLTQALICFSEPKDVFVPGLIVVASAGFILLDCASTEPIMTTSAAAIVIAAVPKKRRRSWLIFFGHLFLSNWTQSSFT